METIVDGNPAIGRGIFVSLLTADLAANIKGRMAKGQGNFDLLQAGALPDNLLCGLTSCPSVNFERFVRRHVLPTDGTPPIWAIDETDHLFGACMSCQQAEAV